MKRFTETTDRDMEITYVDIGNVDSVGGITGTEDLVFERCTFESAAHRATRRCDNLDGSDVPESNSPDRINADTNLIVSTGIRCDTASKHLDDGFVAYALSSPYFR